jgi:hypothetical protein
MNSKYISSKLLTIFIEKNSLDRLAYYVAIKKAHKSGTTLSITKLSKQVGCSYNSLKFHLDLFESLNLLSISDNKLYFTSTKKLIWKRKTKRIQPQNKVVKRKLYLHFKNDQVKELKKEIREFILLNSLFRQGLVQKKQHKAVPLQHAGISAKRLGQKINRSISTGQRLITRMAKNNIIKVTPKFVQMQDSTLFEFRRLRENFLIPQHCKFNNGLIWRQIYSEMEIVVPKVSIKIAEHEFVGPIVTLKTESYTIKVQDSFTGGLHLSQPQGYFNKKYLKKKGMTPKQIKEIFVKEAMCVYSDKDKYPTHLMSFKTLNQIQGGIA